MKIGNGVLYFSQGLKGEVDVMWKDDYGNELWLGTLYEQGEDPPTADEDFARKE